MKTNSFSILFTITAASLAQGNDSSRLDRVERDISELGFMVRQLSAKVEKGFSTNPEPQQPSLKAPAAATHLVRTGDTYWGIARKYGVSVKSLCNANRGISAKRLPIGKRINLPGASMASAPGPQNTSSRNYTVRKGDTLGHIAQRNGVSLRELVSSNPGINARKMQIGKVLHIPSKLEPTTAPVKEAIESTPPPRPVDDLPPLPEIPYKPPVVAPEPEIPAISVEEGTPPPALAEKPEEPATPTEAELDLLDPKPTDLVVIDENSRLTDIASRYLTDVATLNKLNNVELSPDQMIKSGSQLYIPRD